MKAVVRQMLAHQVVGNFVAIIESCCVCCECQKARKLFHKFASVCEVDSTTLLGSHSLEQLAEKKNAEANAGKAGFCHREFDF